ncbi:MAG: ribosomal-protein-alanine acetyltransferase [Alphaproteobacteria bacterium]|nr:MAG: ribosomal-protein-alanine acetyltransferase [Alphaproteobacteria bacterium]
MTVSYQIFGPEAAGMLSEMHRLSFQGGGEQIWSSSDMTTLLAGSGVRALMVSEQSQPVGFILWREAGEEAEILTICIEPAHRARGLAGGLLQEFYGIISGSSVKDVFLEVNETNASALVLYERNGFETVGRRKNYYGGRGGDKQDALVMRYSC